MHRKTNPGCGTARMPWPWQDPPFGQAFVGQQRGSREGSGTHLCGGETHAAVPGDGGSHMLNPLTDIKADDGEVKKSRNGGVLSPTQPCIVLWYAASLETLRYDDHCLLEHPQYAKKLANQVHNDFASRRCTVNLSAVRWRLTALG